MSSFRRWLRLSPYHQLVVMWSCAFLGLADCIRRMLAMTVCAVLMLVASRLHAAEMPILPDYEYFYLAPSVIVSTDGYRDYRRRQEFDGNYYFTGTYDVDGGEIYAPLYDRVTEGSTDSGYLVQGTNLGRAVYSTHWEDLGVDGDYGQIEYVYDENWQLINMRKYITPGEGVADNKGEWTWHWVARYRLPDGLVIPDNPSVRFGIGNTNVVLNNPTDANYGKVTIGPVDLPVMGEVEDLWTQANGVAYAWVDIGGSAAVRNLVDRVSPLGIWDRSMSIDEIPSLGSVLRDSGGPIDMAFINNDQLSHEYPSETQNIPNVNTSTYCNRRINGNYVNQPTFPHYKLNDPWDGDAEHYLPWSPDRKYDVRQWLAPYIWISAPKGMIDFGLNFVSAPAVTQIGDACVALSAVGEYHRFNTVSALIPARWSVLSGGRYTEKQAGTIELPAKWLFDDVGSIQLLATISDDLGNEKATSVDASMVSPIRGHMGVQLFRYIDGDRVTTLPTRIEDGIVTVDVVVGTDVKIALDYSADYGNGVVSSQYSPVIIKVESGQNAPIEETQATTLDTGVAEFRFSNRFRLGRDCLVARNAASNAVVRFAINWIGPNGSDTGVEVPATAGIALCPLPTGQITPLTSRVENPQLSHIHTATDYQSAGGAAGCGPCGASAGGGGGLTTDIRLDRIHRYSDFTRAGSFGPGVFSNLDIGLTLWNHGESGEIWDPSAASPISLTRIAMGRYADQKRSAIQSLVLHAADGTTVVDANVAVTATATQHDGTAWIFELVQAGLGGDADRQGRLTAIRDRTGNQVTIAYMFPADATDAVLGARSRLLEMATATDQRGRQLSFAYSWSCGQPVITHLTYPTGAVVQYHYDGDIAGVARIDYPDGTHSTFGLRSDPASQTMVVDYQDAGAEGTHRTKSVYLTLTDWRNADGTRTQQSPNRVRRVIGPTGEPTYLNWLERDGAQVKIYVFEGGGIAGSGRMLRLDTTEGVTDTTWIAKQWSFATEPATWLWEKVADYEADARFRMGAQTDPLGKSTTYQRDPASGAITGREHRSASGTVVARESTEYNGMRLPTRHQDANGLITRSVYDDVGNLRSRTEGIVMAADGVTEDLSKAITVQWTYRADGQVETETDARGQVTNYDYDARGFRIAEVSPPDNPALPLVRARKQWHYDTVGRLEWSKDAANHTTLYFYDDRNRVQEVRYGNSSKERYDYGTGADANLLLSKTDRDGMVTSFVYDAAGRETSRIEGAQNPAIAVTTTTSYLEGTDLPQVVTRAGQKTEYVYDTRKRVVESRRWVDGSRYLADSTVYDAADRVAYTQDAFGRRSYSVYDDLDRVTRTIREAIPGGVPADADLATLARLSSDNPAYVIEETAYDVGGRVLATTDARGVVTKLGYDQLGRMTDRWEAFETSVEAHWQWTYDAVGNRETETDPLLRVTRFSYTGRNLLAAQTVAVGTDDAATTRFTYTLTGQRATQADAKGHTAQWIYGNCCDWLEDVIDAAGYYTHYTYTPGGLTETVRDANLHLTRTDYDGLKRPSIVTNGDMEATTTIYDDNLLDAIGLSGTYAAELARIADRTGHRAVAVRNHLQEAVVQVSDGLGRTVLVIDAERHVTQTTYDQVVTGADGSTLIETATTDPLNNTVRQRVDGLGRVREVVDAQQQVTTLRYDANGNRRGVADALGHGPSFTYDDRNRQTGSMDAEGNTTSTEYNLVGNVLRQSDGFLHATEFTYTTRNQKKTEKDRLGNTTAFAYDLAGNLLTISDAENEAKKATVTPEVYEAGKTRYTYTERNQLETERFPGETAARSYTYHPNGQLWTRTDQRGRVTTYSYDGANRLTDRSYSDGAADQFVLDDAGRIKMATSGRYGTKVERTWYPTGLIETETTTWPAEVSGVTSSTLVQYDYDAANRATTVSYPGGATLVREFTVRNQLDRLSFADSLLARSEYDDAGRRATLVYGNGLTDTRTYTDDNRLESTVVGFDAPALPVVSLGYQYDENRRKTQENDSVNPTRSQRFGYDDADRLETWSAGIKTQSWTLTPVGDWKNTTVNGVVENREHTAVHEIAKINDVLVAHDAAGNLARTPQGQGFSWDAENRLLMADIAPNSEKSQGQAFYWHDAFGRRVAKRVHGSVTRYVHDGWQVIQELDTPYVATPAEAASDGALANLATVPDGALLYPTYDAEGNRHDPTRVNFQPETESIPDGFISDKGRAFDVRTNGLSYGWDTAHTDAQVRHFHPLPQYDTMGHLGDGSWRIALPNGTYPVAIVAGDATSLAHTNNLVVNGQALTDPDPGDDNTVPAYQKGDFDGWLVNVEVTDGFLTIQAGDGAFDPTLTHVEIGAMGQPITSEMQQRLADQILAATQRTGGSPFWNGGRTETRNYVWDPSYVDALVAYQRTTENGTETFFVHSGAQYSVQAVTDSSGNVVERYSYDAYGTRMIEGASNGGRSVIGLTTAFTGRGLDEETGLYYFRNRMYSGKDGRFIGRDPMGYVSGPSLYSAYYVPNRTDPSGLRVFIPGTGDPKIENDVGSGEWGAERSDLGGVDTVDALTYGLLSSLANYGPYENAAKHMNHYLRNTGEPLMVDLLSMVNATPSARLYLKAEFALALKYVKALPDGNHSYASSAASSGYNTKAESKDWYYAVGGYGYWGKGLIKKECYDGVTTMNKMIFEWKFSDRYNWDGGKSVTIAGVEITDAYVGGLHRRGLAREFSMYGSLVFNVYWLTIGDKDFNPGYTSINAPPNAGSPTELLGKGPYDAYIIK